MTGESGEGLRERKKRQTTNAIELAAVTIALEKGLAQVTIVDICERADVSRSTFFNHMGSREAAIFGATIPLIERSVADEILRDESARLTTLLLRIVFASVGHSWIHPQVAAARITLSVNHPETRHLVAAPLTALFAELSDFLAEWLAENPSRRIQPHLPTAREARHLIALVSAAFHSALLEVSGDSDTVLPESEFESTIDEITALAAARATII